MPPGKWIRARSVRHTALAVSGTKRSSNHLPFTVFWRHVLLAFRWLRSLLCTAVLLILNHATPRPMTSRINCAEDFNCSLSAESTSAGYKWVGVQLRGCFRYFAEASRSIYNTNDVLIICRLIFAPTILARTATGASTMGMILPASVPAVAMGQIAIKYHER